MRWIKAIITGFWELEKELPRSMTVNGSELLEALRARFGADNVKLV